LWPAWPSHSSSCTDPDAAPIGPTGADRRGKRRQWTRPRYVNPPRAPGRRDEAGIEPRKSRHPSHR